MSSFYLFSPEESEVDESDKIPAMSPNSETYSVQPEPIEEEQKKPVPRVRKRRPTKKHPAYAVMVDEAVLKRSAYRKGLSLAAVKKYLLEKYDLNMRFAAKNIRTAVRDSLEKGRYIQTSGHGLSGSFRLSAYTRHVLKIKYENPTSKTLKVHFVDRKREAMMKKKIKNGNRKKGEMAGNIRKRKASPADATNEEEIKKPRREGPSRMKAN